MFCLRTLREMKLLRYFNHENIISILDIQKPRNYDSFTEVYLIQVRLLSNYSLTLRSLLKDVITGTYGDGHAPSYSHTRSFR